MKEKMSVTQTVSEVVPKPPEGIESVRCYGHGLGIYLWPLFVVPLIVGGLVSLGVIEGKTAVWYVIATYAIVVSGLSFNMSRSASIICIVAVLAIVACIRVAELQWQVPLFGYIGTMLRRIPLGWTPEVQGIIYILAFIMAFLFAWELADSRADSRWMFSKNEFQHYSWGRRDAGYARGQFTLMTSTQDLIKYLLAFGGAKIDIVNSDTRHIEATIDNIVGGSRTGARIRQMLQSINVVQVAH